MSWDAYINPLLTSGKISDAAIVGRKGGVWANSKGFELSMEEQRDIISFYSEDKKDTKDDAKGAKAPDAKEIKSGGAKAPGAKEIKTVTKEITEAGAKAPDAIEIKTGVRLANEKYFTLTRIEDSITFRKGSDGAVFVSTKQAILVGIYKQPIQAQEALAIVEHYATHLKDIGY